MSLSPYVERIAEATQGIQAAKAAIASAITAKGGTVGASDGLENFPAAIAGIPSGGETRDYIEVEYFNILSANTNRKVRLKAHGTACDLSSQINLTYNVEKAYIEVTLKLDDTVQTFAATGSSLGHFYVKDERGGTNFAGLQKLTNQGFNGCQTEGDYYFPEFTQSNGWGQSYFNGCKATRAFFPKLRNLGTNLQKLAFSSNLVEAQVGSVGYGINTVGTGTIFSTATHSEFVETLYTDGSRVDALLTLARTSNATATIIVKASEDTTYGGESYLAGETILTDSPEVA